MTLPKRYLSKPCVVCGGALFGTGEAHGTARGRTGTARRCYVVLRNARRAGMEPKAYAAAIGEPIVRHDDAPPGMQRTGNQKTPALVLAGPDVRDPEPVIVAGPPELAGEAPEPFPEAALEIPSDHGTIFEARPDADDDAPSFPFPSLGGGPASRHVVIPDVQTKDGVPSVHLDWIGRYIAAKQPEVVVCIGDFADLPSLSQWDKGKKAFEGRRYSLDIDAARKSMDRLVSPWAKVPGYHPRMVLTLGNHEDRITRATETAAELDQTLGLWDLGYEAFGWDVRPYLEIVKIDGVEYSHYFAGQGAKGFPCNSARALLNARGGSAVMGHVQITDCAFHPRTQACAIFCGICYLHDEPYLGPQGNTTRRQIVVLNEVRDGRFDPMFVSLDFLRRRYS